MQCSRDVLRRVWDRAENVTNLATETRRKRVVRLVLDSNSGNAVEDVDFKGELAEPIDASFHCRAAPDSTASVC